MSVPEHELAGLRTRISELRERGELDEALSLADRAVGLAGTLPPEHRERPAALYMKATVLHRRGDQDEAEALYLEALGGLRTVMGERSPAVATVTNDLALLYSDRGRFAEAAGFLREALEIRRETLGAGHPEVAATLSNLAVVYEGMGRPSDAEAVLNEAVALTREHAPRDAQRAAMLNALGSLHLQMGRYRDAEPVLREALEIAEEVFGRRTPNVAVLLDNLGGLRKDIGDYLSAEQMLRKALSIREEIFGRRHPSVATTMHALGGLYASLGDYDAAEPLYQEALSIRRAALGPEHPDVAHSLRALAGLREGRGDFRQADHLYREALDIALRALGSGHPAVASTLFGMAGLSRAVGDLDQASALYRQAIELYRRAVGDRHPMIADGLTALGTISIDRGDFGSAEELYIQALAIRREVLGDRDPEVAAGLSNLGAVRELMGRHGEAEELMGQALAIRRKVLGERHPDVAESLNNLGQVRKVRGDPTGAVALLREAKEIFRETRGDRHPQVMGALENEAGALAAAGQDWSALPLLEQAADMHDWLIGQVFQMGSEQQRLGFVDSARGQFAIFLSLVLRRLAGHPDAVRSAFDRVLRRKGISAEALASQRDAILGGKYPDLAPKFQRLRWLRMQIVSKSLAGPGPEGPEEHWRLLSVWEQEKEALEVDLAGIPEMNLEQRLREADRQAVARALPEGSALVEFIRFNEFDFSARSLVDKWKPARYVAWVLRAGQADDVRMVDLGEAGPIDDLIAAYRTTLTGEPGSGPADDRLPGGPAVEQPDAGAGETGRPPWAEEGEVGAAVRAAVVDPLVPHLDGRTRLFLAPDGDLTRLPFEVLPMEGGRRVIDAYTVSYLSTGRDVLRFGGPSGPDGGAPLVVADPDFNLATTGGAPPPSLPGRRSMAFGAAGFWFDPLPGTTAEASSVAALLGATAWLGPAALDGNLKVVRAPRVLHLATHGWFLADQPLGGGASVALPSAGPAGRIPPGLENPLVRSGLALAGVNTFLKSGALAPAAEDGILTAEDASGLDLLGTELVVLSACETGLGHVRIGEGVFGLRRAFVLAGARTLVMSLWKVPDKASAELMEAFYRNLRKGMGRAEALRAAQRAMATVYPPPRYWGAFICQGDAGPLEAVPGQG